MDSAEENHSLRQRLRYLIRNQAHLEQRLGRVENSIIFRFLRWAGGILNIDRDANLPEEAEYAAWVRESQAYPQPARAVKSRISLILMVREHADLKQTIASINAQSHADWDLYICTRAPLEQAAGERMVIVESMGAALDRINSPFVGIAGAGAILEPDAVRAWLAVLERESVDAVYSDWDLISKEGRRHSPRFTPEFSPELLSSTPYWGCCFAAKTSAIRNTGCRDTFELSRCLDGSIARIPQILWHLPDALAPAPFSKQPAASNAGETASIVICSRNPKRLEVCLTSLAPTLNARHQVIVVAHSAGGDDSESKRVTERFGAIRVPYQGAFHFGRMNDRGASVARGTVLVLLNDDVRPIAPDWLERMVAQAVRPEIGVVGAMLLYPSGAIQHAGIVVGDMLLPAHAGRSQRESSFWPWLRMTREVTAITGACLATRRAVWDALGGFDARFPVNYNDVDLCLRAWKQGYRVLIETRATLIHEEAATRVPAVRAEESELFWELWSDVIGAPDRFFNPQLELRDEMIRLPRPWPPLR